MRLNITIETKPESLAALKSAADSAKKYFSQRESRETAESIGASGTMFRVFRNVEKPSLHYKNWAFDQTSSPEFERNVLALKSQEDFELFHSTLANSLSDYWTAKTRTELILPHKFKLLDVFIKRACELELPNPNMNDILLSFGHVPLDKWVFIALDEMFSGIFLLHGRAMGNIKTEEAYRFYQKLIRDLMAELGSPSLYFEHFAYNQRDA
jgi:hypothetical protein